MSIWTDKVKLAKNIPNELESLLAIFGDRIKLGVPLARYTTARVGGPADIFISIESVEDLVEVVSRLWEIYVPFILLGGGSNVLVSDAGVRGVVVHNRARQVRFNLKSDPPTVWVASGAKFGIVARQAAGRGLAGLEWAAGIPGTVGGAVVGNAGAHGGDMAGNLVLAEILHREVMGVDAKNGSQPEMKIHRESWPVERWDYSYRSSIIKRDQGGRACGRSSASTSFYAGLQTVVLAAVLQLARSTAQDVHSRINEFVAYRRRTQPPGASMGSMFKNPPGDYAGRLIEAVGLKGTRIGHAGISPLHANFFINYGNATADDIWGLIQLAKRSVAAKFGVTLELEIELIGSWDVEKGL